MEKERAKKKEFLFYLFHRHALARELVRRRSDDPVRSLADGLQNWIVRGCEEKGGRGRVRIEKRGNKNQTATILLLSASTRFFFLFNSLSFPNSP